MTQLQQNVKAHNKINRKSINTKIKLLAIGDLNTGKTSILRRYVYKTYDGATESTIGMDIATKFVKVQEIKWVISFWDIAGQERFIGLTRTYFKNAMGAIVVFDITEKRSLHHAKKWKKDVDNKVFLPNGENIPSILMANKWDLVEKNPSLRQHSDEELDEFCRANNFIGWFSTSAKSGKNVKKAMQCIITATVNRVLNDTQRKDNAGIDLHRKLTQETNENNTRCATCAPMSNAFES